MNDFERQLKAYKELTSKDNKSIGKLLTEMDRVLETIGYEDREYRLPFSSEPIRIGERWKIA